jgi:hypothetical protein
MNAWPNQSSERVDQKHPRESAFRNPFRRLKWNEVVWSGEFVADGRLGFELWEAPAFPSQLVCESNLPEGTD